MEYQQWIDGCRVIVTDWITKDETGHPTIRVGVEHFTPGKSMTFPEWERVIYCPRREEQTIRDHLEAITRNIEFGAIPSMEYRPSTQNPTVYYNPKAKGILRGLII